MQTGPDHQFGLRGGPQSGAERTGWVTRSVPLRVPPGWGSQTFASETLPQKARDPVDSLI